MQVTVFYFSGTGNTWWASEQLCSILSDAGADATCHSVEQVSEGEVRRLLESTDIVGFAYPIYGSDLPAIMKTFLTGLPGVKRQIPALVFCTQWGGSGDGARVASEFLNPAQFQIRWADHINMPSNVSVTVPPFPYTNKRKRLDKKLVNARARLEWMAKRIVDGKPYLKGWSRLAIAMGSIQRVPFRKAFHRLQGDIAVDQQRCIRCGRCVTICPVQNFSWEDGKVKAGNSCIICLRCYSFCPKSAITYMGRRHLLSRGKPYQGPVPGFRPERLIARRGRDGKDK